MYRCVFEACEMGIEISDGTDHSSPTAMRVGVVCAVTFIFLKREGSLVLTFEFLHQVDEELDAALRQSVVERSTEATYRAVTLEAVCTARDSEVVEFGFELLVLVVEDEAYVHDRAVLRY